MVLSSRGESVLVLCRDYSVRCLDGLEWYTSVMGSSKKMIAKGFSRLGLVICRFVTRGAGEEGYDGGLYW